MIAAVASLAVFGAVVGLRFRFRILVPFIVLLFLASLVFSLIRGLGPAGALLAILVAQAILQSGYIVGLIVRVGLNRAQARGRRTPFQSRRCHS